MIYPKAMGVKADVRVYHPVHDGGMTRTETLGGAGMLIFKIFRGPEWAELVQAGETAGAPIDLADGYVHFSTAEQAGETAAKYFAGVKGLVLVAVETEGLGADLKWEESRGGALFPHLYRTLRMTDVVWHVALPIVDGQHRFPAL